MENFSETNNEYVNDDSEELEDLEDPEEGVEHILEAIDSKDLEDIDDTETSSSDVKDTDQEALEDILNKIREELPEESNQIEEGTYDDLPATFINDSLILNEISPEFLDFWSKKLDIDKEKISQLADLNTIHRYEMGKMHFVPQDINYKPDDRKTQREILHTLYGSVLKLALQFEEEKDIRETRNAKKEELDSLYESWDDEEEADEREETIMEELKKYHNQLTIPQHLFGYTHKEMAKFVQNKFDGETIDISSDTNQEGKYIVYADLENIRDPQILEEMLDTFKRLSKIIEKLEQKEDSSVSE